MQAIEKANIKFELEKFQTSIQDDSYNNIGIYIQQLDVLSAQYPAIQEIYADKLAYLSKILKDKNTKKYLTMFHKYIISFTKLDICSNFIPDEINKISCEGSLSTFFYSNSFDIIQSCIIKNNALNIEHNCSGILDFYYKNLNFAYGYLINANDKIKETIKSQNNLKAIKDNLSLKINTCIDFKVLKFSKEIIDFSKNTKMTNKIFKIALLNVILEIKNCLKNVKTDDIESNINNKENVKLLETLSPAEKELFDYLIKGFSLPTIAKTINKSINTLKTQRRNIYNKLNVKDKDELIKKFTPNR